MLKAPNVMRSLAHAVTCRELLWELSPWFNKVLTVQPPGPRVHTHVHTRAHTPCAGESPHLWVLRPPSARPAASLPDTLCGGSRSGAKRKENPHNHG